MNLRGLLLREGEGNGWDGRGRDGRGGEKMGWDRKGGTGREGRGKERREGRGWKGLKEGSQSHPSKILDPPLIMPWNYSFTQWTA